NSLPQYHPRDASRGSAESDSKPDLARAIRHPLREHAVEADRSDEKRRRCKDDEKCALEASILDLRADDFLHGTQSIYRLLGIDRPDGSTHRGSDAHRV